MGDAQLPLFDAIEIPLTKGYVALVDPIDADLLKMKWYALSRKNKHPYVARSIRRPKATVLIHRIIMARILDRELEQGEIVDHWDLNPLNNRRSNLRLCTHSQNRCNTRKGVSNTSGYKGVCLHKKTKKWAADIKIGTTRIRLGLFPTPEDAYEAYKQAAVKHHGEFARFD